MLSIRKPHREEIKLLSVTGAVRLPKLGAECNMTTWCSLRMLLCNATPVLLNVKSAASVSVQVYDYPKAGHLLCLHTQQYVNLKSEQITSVM